MSAQAVALTLEQEIAQRLASLEILKNVFLAHLDPKRIEEWDGTKGPMYNLHFKDANAVSPIKQFTNKEGTLVEVPTIGALAGHVVDNLKGSGYWIEFNINRPDKTGNTTPVKITMWSYAKSGFIVCKGRDQFSSTISGSVSKSQPKQPKVVDASGNETSFADVKMNLGLFSNKGNVGNGLIIT